jgi:hypothetical protein
MSILSSSPFFAWATLAITAILFGLLQPTEAQVAAQNRLLKSDAIVPMKTHSIYAREWVVEVLLSITFD